MAKYINQTASVVVVSGVVVPPRKPVELDDKAPGIDRLLKRELLKKVDGRVKQ